MEETIINAKFDFLSGGGEMGELIRSKDWSKTPLGSPDTWPQSLRTAVSICVASNFPIAIAWGPHRVQIYNDGYWPITGDMHPTSLGQDFKECWISAWPVIGQAFEEAFLGQTRFLENQRIFLDRYGYKEETFFTFSFSPILDESGGVGGLFHPVIEQTQQTLAERRLNILPAIANQTVNARTAEEASALTLKCIKDFELDLPFVLLYSIAADGKEAYLAGSVGVEKGSALTPAKINLKDHALQNWPFTEVIQNGKAVQVEELAEIFGSFNCGPYPEPPKQALVFPIILPGAAHNNYFLVAGVSSRRSLDQKYLLFYELLAASVTNVLTKAIAYEEERKKAEALAEIDRVKTVFFSNISHEFRTPLTLMLSPLEELLKQKKNNFSENEKQNIETAQRNAMRLLKLVNTLLDFSRIESGRQRAMFSLVDIVSLTKYLAANFRSVIEKAGLKLIVQADTIIQPVYVDKQMWEKIVFNLLSNAFKYTLEGKIIVELSTEKDFAVLKVKDTGVGIPENELPKMFERFHRVQNVTGRTYEGTGIGLSLVKELLQMHHGSINVESSLNKGSTFTVKIPFGKEHLDGHQISKTEIDANEIFSNIYVEEIETLLETEKREESKTTSVKEKNTLPTVLVVDDNADMRQHISAVLSNNFNVITASNGMDALHKMKETIPSLVLSDIMMPVMDGIGLLKEIKSKKATANIPVIFLTARAGEESRIEGLETGADDYLVKPFSAKELVARVRAQIKIVKLRNELEGNVRNLFLEAPAIICVLRGPQHVLELANDMYLQMIGNRDVLGKPIREALPELEGQGFFELMDNVYTTGEPITGNETPVKLDRGNGKLEETYFNFVYQPSHNSEGEIDGILVHGVDVTEQVLARKKIEESEKRSNGILMQSPFAFSIMKGKDMVITHANDLIKDFWGKGNDVEGKTLLELLPELKDQPFPEMLDSVYTTGKSISANEILARLNRHGIIEEHYFNLTYQPHFEADETISGVITIAHEVTEQVLARKKIEDSEAKFRTLIEDAPVATCFFTGREMTIEIANDIMIGYWGKGKNVIGKTLAEAVPELIGQPFLQILDEVFTSGQTYHSNNARAELTIDEVLGTYYFDYTYKPIFNASGEVYGIMDMAVDVTEQVLARKKIEESEYRYHNMIYTSPSLIAIFKGQDMIIDIANDAILESWGKGKDIIGKSLMSVMPEIVEQDFEKMLLSVYETGEPYYAYEMPVTLIKNGKPQLMHYTFIYQAQHNADGKIEGVAVIANEVTPQVELNKKIKSSEEKFRLLVLQAPVAICVLRGENYVIEVINERMFEMWDRSLEQVLNKPVFDVLPELREQGFKELLDTVYKTGERFVADELPINLKRNGKLENAFVKFVYEPLREADGIVSGVMALAHEISEQVVARKKVEESEERFRSLAQTLPQLVWVTDAQGNAEFASVRWKEYSGIDPGGEKEWKAIVHPDDYDNINATWVRSLTTGDVYTAEVRLKNKNGQYKWHAVIGEPVVDKENKITKWVGAFTDIHEQKEAAEKIRESEKQFSTLANSIPNLAWIADGEGWIYWYNQRWYEYTGTILEEMKGWGWEKVHHPEHIERVVDFVKQAWKKNEPWELTFPLRGANGKYRWFLTRVFPVNDAEGKILRWVGTNTDIEEQKTFSEQLEEKVNERTIQLNEVNENLEEKNNELQKMNKELEAFTYISSHDLQEPLRKIQTFAGRIIATEKEQLSDTAKDYFSRMQYSALRMQTLIHDLLTFSRVSTSERKFEKIDLTKIIDEVKEDFNETIEDKNATITAGEMCEVNIISFQFRQLMHNLISNALKFSKQDVPPRIIIKSELIAGSNSPFESRGACHITVIDNGIGFEQHYSEKIFGVFQKLHGKDEYAGTGIGLAIVKKIVDNHNGIITAESEIGKGAIFNIYLPH